MDKEKKYDSMIEMYAKMALVIYNNFDMPIYDTARENKYPYTECLYQYYVNSQNKSNSAMLFINSIYLDESMKMTIEEIAGELSFKKKK